MFTNGLIKRSNMAGKEAILQDLTGLEIKKSVTENRFVTKTGNNI